MPGRLLPITLTLTSETHGLREKLCSMREGRIWPHRHGDLILPVGSDEVGTYNCQPEYSSYILVAVAPVLP
jgi:hypothetical protein